MDNRPGQLSFFDGTVENAVARSGKHARVEGQRKPTRSKRSQPASGKSFPFKLIDDVEVDPDPPSLIQGILPSAGLMAVYGPPKSGKSFILIDALFHVAAGSEKWAGRLISKRGGTVIYITGEGLAGFTRRLVALREHHRKTGVPFVLIPVAPNLGMGSGDAAELVRQIKLQLSDRGLPPVAAVAIDTLARSMHGGDENSAKDMAQFISNCDRVARELSCVVCIVCHTGWDNNERPKGSIALAGSIDMAWALKRTAVGGRVTTRFAKDFEEGLAWEFALVSSHLGHHDVTNEPVDTQLVEIISEPSRTSGQKRQRPGRPKSVPDRVLFAHVKDAFESLADRMPKGPNWPSGERGVRRDQLKTYLDASGWKNHCQPEAKAKALQRGLSVLEDAGFLTFDRDWVWGVDLKPTETDKN